MKKFDIVEINGIKVRPYYCLRCGSEMSQGGSTIGAGDLMQWYVCKHCKASLLFMSRKGKEVDAVNITYKDIEEKENG